MEKSVQRLRNCIMDLKHDVHASRETINTDINRLLSNSKRARVERAGLVRWLDDELEHKYVGFIDACLDKARRCEKGLKELKKRAGIARSIELDEPIMKNIADLIDELVLALRKLLNDAVRTFEITFDSRSKTAYIEDFVR